MKSSALPESDFREILSEYLLPFFPNAELRENVGPTFIKSDKLVVQEGNNSATTFILKSSVNSDYRIRLWRSQKFSREEKKLMEVFLAALAERDLPAAVAHRRDTLTSVVNESVAKFASPGSKDFLLELLTTLTEWAQQTYEGERIAFSAGILWNSKEANTGPHFSKIEQKDFTKVLSNAQDTLLVFDFKGHLVRHENCFDSIGNLPKQISADKALYTPIRFDALARWTAGNFQSVIVALTRHGELLIFRDGHLLFAKRRGNWRYFTHSVCIDQFTHEALAPGGSRAFREQLYLTALDVAFSRKGGCIGVFRGNDEILGIDLVDKQDRLRNPKADSDSAKALRIVIDNKPFQKLSRLLRMELAGIDGSLVLDYKGNILAVGAILSIKSRSEDGGGRQAAAESLSENGLGIKISNDGYIRAFGARKEIFTIG